MLGWQAISDRPDEMLNSIERRLEALGLDLHGLTVVTEAATGAYASTAVIAALAGATVFACAGVSSRYGTAADAIAATRTLARRAGVEDRISFLRNLPASVLQRCDILTNSGHIRPIAREMIEILPDRSVIALMFEAWEFRDTDIDLAACRRRGIRIAAVNERHADVGVFRFLGPLCTCLLRDAGVTVDGCHIAILCDNPFAEYLREGLCVVGAAAELFSGPADLAARNWDVVVVALGPAPRPHCGHDLAAIARKAPGALVAQFWGDLDRGEAERLGLPVCPAIEPRPGHMGILLNRLGPEPIIRLQTGGLKAAELVWHGRSLPADGIGSIY